MKRVMILAYYFPPLAVSGSMRPAGFCSHLRELGYEPHVLSNAVPVAGEASAIPVDESLERLLPPDIRVDRIAHSDWMQILLDWRSRFQNRPERTAPSVEPLARGADANDEPDPDGVLRAIRDRILNRLLLFPDRQHRWVASVKRFARRLPAADRPEIVFATGNPWSALVAGAALSKLWGVPFVADFRDPWTQNPKPPLPELINAAAAEERRIIESADRVVANTAALERSFAELYPNCAGKLVTITNGYHESLLKPPQQRPVAGEFTGIELNYYGSVYELRKPLSLLEALDELATSGRLQPGDLQITFTGNWGVSDSDCNALADRLERAGLIVREAAVGHEEYLARIRSAQHLLVLQQDFPLQIPGKIYEYIATGRPLLLVGGEGATASLVREGKLGFVCADDKKQLADAMLALVRRELSIPPPAPSTVSGFGYRALTGKLAGVFDELLGEQRQ